MNQNYNQNFQQSTNTYQNINTNKTRICPRCGNIVNKKVTYCPFCRSKIKSGNNGCLIVLIAVIVMFLVFAAVVGSNSDNKKAKENAAGYTESEYKEMCKSVSYDEIARSSEAMKGQYITFSGEIGQVISDGKYSLYVDDELNRIVFTSDTSKRILEGDEVTIWGESVGFYEGTTVLGASVKEPEIAAVYVNIKKSSDLDPGKNDDVNIDDPDVPKEYTNALKKAKIYSDEMYMSKAAIYDILTSEYGEAFSEDAATYAIENLDADYYANALHKAQIYQDDMAMSPSNIYEQLISENGEQFTEEEAQYAIDNLQ